MRLIFLFLSLQIAGNTFSQDQKEPEQIISFEAVSQGILRVFPEAYDDFLSVCFTQINGLVVPDQATFLIAESYFKKKLNQKVLEERAQLLLDQLELSPACQSISVGETEEYSWQEWKEKKVKKVTLTFGIGC